MSAQGGARPRSSGGGLLPLSFALPEDLDAWAAEVEAWRRGARTARAAAGGSASAGAAVEAEQAAEADEPLWMLKTGQDAGETGGGAAQLRDGALLHPTLHLAMSWQALLSAMSPPGKGLTLLPGRAALAFARQRLASGAQPHQRSPGGETGRRFELQVCMRECVSSCHGVCVSLCRCSPTTSLRHRPPARLCTVGSVRHPCLMTRESRRAGVLAGGAALRDPAAAAAATQEPPAPVATGHGRPAHSGLPAQARAGAEPSLRRETRPGSPLAARLFPTQTHTQARGNLTVVKCGGLETPAHMQPTRFAAPHSAHALPR
jgi:hypothetical protein